MSIVTLWVIGVVIALIPTFLRIGRDVWQGRSSSEIRRAHRGSASEYDGHKDYLEEIETPQARLFAWIIEPVDMIIALLGGLTIARWLHVPGLSYASSGPLGAPFLLFSLFVLLIATGVIYAIMSKLHEAKGRLYSYPIVVALFVFGFLLPKQHNDREHAKAIDARVAAMDLIRDNSDAVRAKWRADVAAAGAHGGAGVDPPMLEVTLDGDVVRITNITDRKIESVCLARVVRESTAFDGYLRCPLREKSGGRECPYLSAHGVQELVMEKRNAESRCADGRLEFRVGEYMHPEPSWWSDTALTWFDRNEEAIQAQQR